MSDNLTLQSARKLYAEMVSHQRGGCDAGCVSKQLYFHDNNCGCDRRYPTGVIAGYMKREFGFSEEELAEENGPDFPDEFPALTRTHPIRIVWRLADLKEEDELVDSAWILSCPWSMEVSRTSSVVCVDPVFEEMR